MYCTIELNSVLYANVNYFWNILKFFKFNIWSGQTFCAAALSKETVILLHA
jgi:hypothetical protein